MKSFIAIMVTATCLAVSQTGLAVVARNLDLAPYVANDLIISDAFSDPLGTINHVDVQVYSYDLALEDPGDGVYAGEVGMNVEDAEAERGSPAGFPGGSQAGLQFVDVLQFWDGTGAVSFGAPLGTLGAEVVFGPGTRELDGSSFDGTPFLFIDADSHGHVEVEFDDSASMTIPAGVYLIEAQVINGNVTGIDLSGTVNNPPAPRDVYLLFGHDVDEATILRAGAQFDQNGGGAPGVPEPASAGLLALGLAALMRRKRREPLA